MFKGRAVVQVPNLKPTVPAISGLVPPRVGQGNASRIAFGGAKALPIPLIPSADPSPDLVYGFATLSVTGRLGEREIVQRLGWTPGTRIHMSEHAGLILVTADLRGVFQVSGQGFLLLPAVARRWCQLTPGDRVLLVGDLSGGWLVIHPPASLTTMTAAAHARVWGGGDDR
ncbi:hypothetical protein [Kineosporia sp. NBRC 101731]|uniref:hypothetical protein n=1 Tax=Kineosporia sp. NBRC 101731 TaxID=3032199 RepID=UPI0024A21A93|nr:hypothetical protein [Kineosporia sp. NBRC 101731]GLY33796.1 hypothetical protein Kisp02_71610 [Kineosporia sp. NBRC 101731]